MYYFYCCAYARAKVGFAKRAPAYAPLGPLRGGAVPEGALKRASAKRLLWTPGSSNLFFGQLQFMYSFLL